MLVALDLAKTEFWLKKCRGGAVSRVENASITTAALGSITLRFGLESTSESSPQMRYF